MPKSLEAIYAQTLQGTGVQGRVSRVWPYIALCAALSFAAIAAGSPYHLMLLTAFNIVFGVAAGVGSGYFKKALRVFLIQSALIVILYGIRFGFGPAVLPGLTVSWKMALAFIPGFIFMSAVPHHRVAGALSGILPYRLAFVLGATMTFLPKLLSDVGEIYHVQVLRGARILPRDMLRPSGWRDAIGCVLVPAVVRAMTLAHEIAISAEARGFGMKYRRTEWPGE